MPSALSNSMHGRTSFAIAHGLSTIGQATQMLVIKDSAIIERGTHDQLLGQHGFYAHLYRSQSEGLLRSPEPSGGAGISSRIVP